MPKDPRNQLFWMQLLPSLPMHEGRLERWAEVFEDWLEAREREGGAQKREQALIAWKDFLGWLKKPPGDAATGEVENWVEELQDRGLKPSTISWRLLELSKFYQFFQQEQVKRGGIRPNQEVFDPTRGVKRPRKEPPQEANYLSAEEAQALLGCIDKDSSVFGKRDYALILTHLVSGLNSSEIRNLRWGDILRDEQGWQVKRGKDASLTTRLPEAVEAAILDYLEDAGRLESIQAKDYVFAPFVDPLGLSPGGKSSDWDIQKPISQDQVRWLLRRYAAWAGLDERRITCQTLHNTAALLRLEAGEDFRQIQAFLGHGSLASTLKMLKQLRLRKRNLVKKGRRAQARPYQARPYQARPYRRKTSGRNIPGNLWALKHGMYARRLLGELVKEAMIYSNDELESEIAVQRVMNRRAMELSDKVKDINKKIHLLNLMGIGCSRVGKLMQIQQQMREGAPGKQRKQKTEARLSPEWEELIRNVEESLRKDEEEKKGPGTLQKD